MIQLGQYNKLTILDIKPFEMLLEDEKGDIIRLNEFTEGIYSVGDNVEVFVYRDKSGELVATLRKPKAVVGEFAWLPVVDVNKYGAFLDWGLGKDLFVPFREQKEPMRKGKSYLVYVMIDEKSDRIIASAKVRKFLEEQASGLNRGDKVQLIVESKTDLGYSVIINHRFLGLVYQNEIFQPLKPGQSMEGYVKTIRSDGKIDVSLSPIGFSKMEEYKKRIIEKLVESGGFLPLHDKSSPEEIKNILQMSKKSFKSAIGMLYKENKVNISKEGISLNP